MEYASRGSRPIAGLILIVMALGCLAAYPFSHSFWGGLIFHGATAGLIGGLADWYAVTALFTKPLGIAYKTNLIEKNRDRFISLARDTVINELLRRSHIYGVVKKEDLFRRLLAWLLTEDGDKHTVKVMNYIVEQGALQMEGLPVRTHFARLMEEGVSKFPLSPIVLSLGRSILESDSFAVVWRTANRILQCVLRSASFTPYLERMLAAVIDRYVSESVWRELALLFGPDSLQPEYLAKLIQTKGTIFLVSQEGADSPLGLWVRRHLVEFITELATNEEWQERLEKVKREWLPRFLNDVEFKLSEEDCTAYIDVAKTYLQDYVRRLLTDEEQCAQAERLVYSKLPMVIDSLRPHIVRIMDEALGSYSAQSIRTGIQQRWYYDLQMVRVNGSFVGVLLGTAFYLAVYAIGEVIR